jgi:hypothetical protein
MVGELDLDTLLAAMQPTLLEGEFVFCSVPGMGYRDLEALQPLACYREAEGLSLLLPRPAADLHKLEYESVFRGITLAVHSSLDAVGFTAAVASKLAALDIPANVIAAFYHDHVFVPLEKAERAMACLATMAPDSRS